MYTEFATAFANAGHSWTSEFCKATFPGDSMTNGEAFSDPCCTWTKGGTTDFTVPAFTFTTSPIQATTCASTTNQTSSTSSTAASTTSSTAASSDGSSTPTTTDTLATTDVPIATDAPTSPTMPSAMGGCAAKGAGGKGTRKGSYSFRH
ncbi:hypothetical protein GN958_ATG06783 [Phytophthora infestans]|uniref:Temptin Cys/Cys disulfide domain-containing protein n=1 Tax=Phytophthora infestans TaxID=4787 RepID=A0A8S9UTJ3_PHYIN|nr:hypothetical protein GN958_ATG06783 [Phytophthora infestans]